MNHFLKAFIAFVTMVLLLYILGFFFLAAKHKGS